MADELKVKDVVEKYLDERQLTQEQLATALTESLVNTGISRVSVTNWANGKTSPSTDFLLVCIVAYTDWRRAFAVHCLEVKLPEVFESGMVRLPVAE
jgi:predicted XRE-type DNA-binding protein